MVRLIAAIGLWGSVGEHDLVFVLELAGERQELYRGKVRLEFLPEDVDLQVPLTIEMPAPGPAFLDCWVGGKRLARRALYFGNIEMPAELTDAESRRHAAAYEAKLSGEARNSLDPEVEGDRAALVYLALCQGVTDEGMTLRLDRHFGVVYSRTYPVEFRAV